MTKDKCDNCGTTKTNTFWTFEDHTILCDKCHKHYGKNWQREIDRPKRIKFLKRFSLITGIVVISMILLFAVYYYLLNGFGFKGYNRLGFDKYGYSENGFNVQGFDKEGYDTQGYNNVGIDRNGYDREGYNKYGFNSQGYNRQGFDSYGYNSLGYDKEGYNRNGYNPQGFNRAGRDSLGYDIYGYDIDGYDRTGLDKNGHHKNPSIIQKIQEIAQDYHKTSSYTLPNLFVCTDMSSNIWDLLYAQGINAKICAGDIEQNLYDKSTYYEQLADMPHAWVLAETKSSSYVAVESTGGYLVWGKGKGNIGDVENDLYYNGGMCFHSPKDFKNFLTLRDRYFTVCYQANVLVNYWNQNIAGTIATGDTYQFQGVMITKQQECNQITSELKALTG